MVQLGRAILDLVLGNKPGQAIQLSVGKHLRKNAHNSLHFKIVRMNKDNSGPQGKVLTRKSRLGAVVSGQIDL